MGQTETQSDDSTTFKISDYSVTGLPKEDLLVKISNVYASNNSILMDFEIDLTENNYFTDVSEKVTGMSGSTTLMGTFLHYDKDYFINAKFSFDNNLLSNEAYPVSWETNSFMFLRGISQKALMKHFSFTFQTKVNHQLIKVRVNLKNPLLQQFIKQWAVIDNGPVNTFADIDAFVARFGHGKIPVYAIIAHYNNGGGFPSDIILKTVKPASFYAEEDGDQLPIKPVMPMFEMGILPEGILIDFHLKYYKLYFIDGKYIQIALNESNPFNLEMKNKYEGKLKHYWVGLIPLDALDFGNKADRDKYESSMLKGLVYYAE